MADVTESYTLNFETNAQKATGLIAELERTLSGMQRSGELAGKGLNQASRGILAIEGALGSSSGAVKKYSDSFSNLRKEVSKATEALQEAAQAYVVGGGTDVLGAATRTMDLGEAEEILAIREAEGLTAEQVASQVVAANKRKEQAEEAYATAMRQGMARLEQIQKSQTDSENAESLRVHNLKMARLQEEVAKESAAVQKILAERQKLNAESAKAYQNAYTDPKSFFGQANSRDASSGLKASETSWAIQAKQQQAFRSELAQTEVSFQKQRREAELTAMRLGTSFTPAVEGADGSVKKLSGSLPTLRYAMYDVARTAGVMSTAMLGTVTGITLASASYEKAFTSVERTSGVTGEAVQYLRNDLIELSRAIPLSFGEISNLAARGAQLGIASKDLSEFTEVVAQFVATSDTVTLDQAVEAFGRIANLTGDNDFRRLGSAITFVGVNAAATESQILKTTQELAPFAAAIGLSSYEVAGLATALASLGQPPERARSSMLSLQSVMDNAVAGMNEKLPVFADLLGKSAEEVENLWSTDPQQFIASFVEALGATDNLTLALADLGLNEKRASQVFQALAADSRNAGGGLSVLNQAFSDVEEGYNSGTELARQYALIVDDLASKWQLFLNGVQELAASLGDALAPAAKMALDVLTNLVTGLSDVAKHPVGKTLAVITGVLTLVAGATLAVVTAVALGVAGMAAFKTAVDQLTITSTQSLFSIKGLNAAITEAGVAAGVSSTAIKGFKLALASTGIGLAVVALGSLAAAAMSASGAFKSVTDQARDVVGDVSGIFSASAQDAQEAVEKYGSVEKALKTAGSGYSELSLTVDEGSYAFQRAEASSTGLSSSQLGLATATDSASNAIQNQTFLLGQHAQSAIQNAILSIDGMADAMLRLEGAGLDLDSLIGALREGDTAAASEVLGAFTEELERAQLGATDVRSELQNLTAGELSNLAGSLSTVNQSVSVTEGLLGLLGIEARFAGDQSSEAANGLLDVADGSDIADEAVSALETSLKMLSDEFNFLKSSAQLGDTMASLIEALGSGAVAADTMGSAILLNVDDIQKAVELSMKAGAAQGYTAVQSISAMFHALKQEGVDTAVLLSQLSKMGVTSLGGVNLSQIGKSVKSASSGVSELSNYYQSLANNARTADSATRGAGNAAEKAGKQAREAAEQVYTLSNYASDLSSIWKRAFDIRFSGQQSFDSIQDAFQKIRDAAAASAEKITDLRTSIRSLTADISSIKSDIGILEYYLSVAREYGDTKRATALEAELAKKRAELADKTNDLAKKSKDLKKEQDSQNKTLEGNSQSARDNRRAVEDLVQKYQEHIRKLAESGMSQADLERKTAALKEEFIRQATQLGYSRKELEKYAKGFDDVRVAIANVPRNITVQANANPALQALKEFEAAAKSRMSAVQADVNNRMNAMRGNLSSGIQLPITTVADTSGARRTLEAMIRVAEIQYDSAVQSGNDNAAIRLYRQLERLRGRVWSTGFASGGYTGRGGVNDVAGLVHSGEFVIPQRDVNQATGLPYADALGRMMNGAPSRYTAPASNSSSSGVAEVALTAGTIQAIAQATGKAIYLDGKLIADASANAYAHQNNVGAY